MHLRLDGCDTVKTLEAIFVRGYCIVESYVWSSFPEIHQSRFGTWIGLFMGAEWPCRWNQVVKSWREIFDSSKSSLGLFIVQSKDTQSVLMKHSGNVLCIIKTFIQAWWFPVVSKKRFWIINLLTRVTLMTHNGRAAQWPTSDLKILCYWGKIPWTPHRSVKNVEAFQMRCESSYQPQTHYGHKNSFTVQSLLLNCHLRRFQSAF